VRHRASFEEVRAPGLEDPAERGDRPQRLEVLADREELHDRHARARQVGDQLEAVHDRDVGLLALDLPAQARHALVVASEELGCGAVVHLLGASLRTFSPQKCTRSRQSRGDRGAQGPRSRGLICPML